MPMTWEPEPAPPVPCDAVSGLALSQANSSLKLFTGTAALVTTMYGLSGNSAIGSRSFRTSYETFWITPLSTCVPQLP